ncbi:hypothetical protein HNO88_002688 [Novosphingobium chloroacetimidivorans]|uniref:Uncharacterized protein n=1 Tax=Novosphingobium chloroacetimidivorans TaxID=1428314 RepID=A0A7W7KBS1_9SPHN|nr:hypothetical protein [Novosphingobium chloroacetimidivorans]MBB4859359.1 hypothetical protein [Novosphingobium chloroacetimidivorans]
MKTIWLSGLLLAASAIAGPAMAQPDASDVQPLHNRDRWLPKSVPTSDDVLRIPVPADYNAPKGAFVLVGGRLFDGTGAPARPSTVVVEGKTITAVLGAGRSELAQGRDRLRRDRKDGDAGPDRPAHAPDLP